MTKETVETARKAHTSPVATAALEDCLLQGYDGVMMKGDKDILTLQIQASGPLKELL